MRPTTRRVTAQRKFAQGAFVPSVNATVSSSNATTSTTERRELPQPATDKSTNVFHNNMTAKSLLDVVCFQGSHSHLQPVVLVERLQDSRPREDEETTTSTQAPRPKQRAGRPARDRRTSFKHLMTLRNRKTNQSSRQPQVEKVQLDIRNKKVSPKPLPQVLPPKLPPKPDPKKNISRGRKRKAPEFTLDDNRPLTYFAKCSTPKKRRWENTDDSYETPSLSVAPKFIVTDEEVPSPILGPTPPSFTPTNSEIILTPSTSTAPQPQVRIASDSPASYYSEQGIHRWIDGSITEENGSSLPPTQDTTLSEDEEISITGSGPVMPIDIKCISTTWQSIFDVANATQGEFDSRCATCDQCITISKVMKLSALLKNQRGFLKQIDYMQDDYDRTLCMTFEGYFDAVSELLPKHQHLVIKISSIEVGRNKKYVAYLMPRSEDIIQELKLTRAHDRIIDQVIENVRLDMEQAQAPSTSARADSPIILHTDINKLEYTEPDNSQFIDQDDGTILEAPVFNLSTDEYESFESNPLQFIETIWDQVAHCGICKIVPPENFIPTCKADDETRFEVSNQYISRMYNRWGPSAREMCAIKACLKAQNMGIQRPPLLEGLEVNLPKLYHIVQRHGGLENVINKKKWGKVAEEMKLKRNPMIEKKLDAIYFRYLLPYDTLSSEERQGFGLRVEKAWTKKNQKLLERASNPLHRQKRLLGESDSSSEEIEDDETADAEDCVKPGALMNLAKFKKIARTAFDNLFRNQAVNAKYIEDEYWHHVTIGSEHVCINTASIDTKEQGLGFPDIKTENKSPWNLKAISNHPDNVLRSLGPAVGVTIPTLHLGMVFSTSCWHRDPHSIPWMEFLHHGTVKIWYGVPERQDMNFRRAAETLNPTACQNKSLWLSSDIAMIPPTLLRDHGVKVYRVEQIPGEYVLVMPRAYSCSISTDFTISESAYFATERWLDTLVSVFQEIRDSCEPTMFALEQLLKCLVEDPDVKPTTLMKIRFIVRVIFCEEITNRDILISRGIKLTENIQPCNDVRSKGKRKPTERPPTPPVWTIREQEECEICRCTLYLSKVKNIPLQNSLVCLTHALELLDKKKYENVKVEDLELVVDFSTEEIQNTMITLQNRVDAYVRGYY